MLTAGHAIRPSLPPIRRVVVWGPCLLVWGVILLAAVPGRAAATPPPGSLSQLEEPFNCVGEEGFHQPEIGCGTLLPKNAINGSYQAQVSPDGKNVYSVAVSGALVEYSRDRANGALTEIGCLTSSTEPCAPANSQTEAVAMSSPAALAISPDGANVYVVTQGTNSLVEFSRNQETGLLTETGCISRENTACVVHNAGGLNSPYGVTISPDGKNVYTAAYADEAIAEFSRNTETGALKQLSGVNNCITSGSTGLTGCNTEKALGLERAIGVAISPDGRNVYVAAGATNGEGAIVAFARNINEEGALTQLPGEEGCISTSNAKCAKGVAIDGPEDLVTSPDGRNVYANSSQNNSVLEFRRESTGTLAQLASPNACVMNAPAEAQCTQVKGLEKALGVTISPQGENVYASSAFEDDEAVFTRNAETGVLTSLPPPYECLGKAPYTKCETTGIKGIAGARRVTVSPDGMNLYVAGQNDHSIVELARAVAPTVSSVAPGSGSESGDTIVTITGAGFVEGAIVDFGGRSASSVTVNSSSSITAISPGGSGTVDVTVTTYAGSSTTTAGDQFTYTKAPTAKIPSLVTPIAPITLLAVPPPVLGKTGNVAPVSGTVFVRLPKTSRFVPLSTLEQIPFGSVIEATHGTVSVTTTEPNGKTQTGEFFEGEFILRQGANGVVIAELTGGNFSVCPTRRERAHIASVGSLGSTGAGSTSAHAASASGSHVVRKLWANAHGKFSTKGNYAAGAVQGTEWLTEDRCDGTYIKVTRDRVAVTNLVNHRRVEVTTRHHYLAKAPRG